jgi:hypothetical protein
MRQLRFVTLTEDGNQLLVETTDGDEQFALSLDATLRGAVQVELAPRPAPIRSPANEPEPAAVAVTEPALVAMAVTEAPISPREIQVRVRAGESPETIAAAYGMPLERVMRFAGAVLDERIRIADEARRARARRGIEGGESKPVVFGEAVDERFRAHGIAADTVSWDSRRRDDGEWLVVAEWLGGDATHGAEWLFSRASRSVTPLDDTAADLLSDRPIRPAMPPQPTRLSLAAAPPLVPGIVSFPPMPDADTGPVPTLDEVFDQIAPSEGPRDVPPLVPASASMDFDAPPLPLGINDPATRRTAGVGALRNLGVTRREESDEERAARARVPSWDDILLGIRRKED